MNITTVGLDLAKNVFHVICLNEHNKEVKKRMLRRNQISQFFAQLPSCRVAMVIEQPLITGDGRSLSWGMM